MLSARLALSAQEMDFLIKYAAGLPQVEAYARAFKDSRDFPRDDRKAQGRAAAQLLKQDYIQAALKELEGDAQEMAERAYRDQMVIGKGNAVLGAAKQILEHEALQAAKSDQERFLMIAAACGAVVRARVGDEDVVVPVRDLFPKFKEATPPPEVLAKTAKSLAAWYDVLTEKEADLDERERELRTDA